MGASQPEHDVGGGEGTRKTFGFEVAPEAEQELVEAITFYEEAQEGLGDRFHRAIRAAFLRIVEHPYQYPGVSNVHRKATVDVFPYCIYYAVSEALGMISVLAVHHAKRHPRRWRTRKPRWRK